MRSRFSTFAEKHLKKTDDDESPTIGSHRLRVYEAPKGHQFLYKGKAVTVAFFYSDGKVKGEETSLCIGVVGCDGWEYELDGDPVDTWELYKKVC